MFRGISMPIQNMERAHEMFLNMGKKVEGVLEV
jgi:hypothetical protein